MTAEANDNLHPYEEEDLNTTVPNIKTPAWTMPDPVFRRTSGRLPEGFEKNYTPATDAAQPTDEASAEPVAVAEPAPEPKPENPTLKLMLVIAGLIGMVAFLVVFLTVVYFFFLRSSPD